MSSGLTIYSRSCEEGCSADFSLVKEDVLCKMEKEPEVEKKKSCCAKDKHENHQKEEQPKEDCCDIEVISLDADFYGFFPNFDLEQLVSFIGIPAVAEFTFLENNDTYQFIDLPPPDLGVSGRFILLQKNSFLI